MNEKKLTKQNNQGQKTSNSLRSPYKKKTRPATPEFTERNYEQYETHKTRPMNSYNRYDTG